jgi:hypothetical protein
MNITLLLGLLLAQPDAWIERLNEKWRLRKSDIITAEIEFKAIRGFDGYYRYTKLTEIEPILKELEAANSVDDRVKTALKLFKPEAHDKILETVRLDIEGKRFREDIDCSQYHRKYIFDGERELVTDAANSHLFIHNRGGARIGTWTLHDLRLYPDPIDHQQTRIEVIDEFHKKLIRSEPNDGNKKIWQNSFSIIDTKDDSIKQSHVYAYHKLRAISYFGTDIVFNNGISMPSYYLDISFAEDTIRNVQFTCFVSGKFNETIDEERFKMPAPKDWLVHDCRSEPGNSFRMQQSFSARDATRQTNDTRIAKDLVSSELAVHPCDRHHGVADCRHFHCSANTSNTIGGNHESVSQDDAGGTLCCHRDLNDWNWPCGRSR